MERNTLKGFQFPHQLMFVLMSHCQTLNFLQRATSTLSTYVMWVYSFATSITGPGYLQRLLAFWKVDCKQLN